MEIKKVLKRKGDEVKLVVIPKNSPIEAGDYVSIQKIILKDKEVTQ